MARSRNIELGFFTNDEFAEYPPYVRLLLAGLQITADKGGRLDDRPKKVRIVAPPFDNADCNDLPQQLRSHKLTNRYQVSGDSYIQINNWKKHQNLHCKEAASGILEPVGNDDNTEQEQCKDGKKEDKKDTESPQVIENNKASKKHHASVVQEPVKNNLNPANSLSLIPDFLISHTDSLINTQAADAICEGSEVDVRKILSCCAFEGNITRLNHKDYEAWKRLYPNIDLKYGLEKLDIEFNHKKPKNRFITVGQKFSYQNKQALSRPVHKIASGLQPEGFVSKDYGKTEIPPRAQE